MSLPNVNAARYQPRPVESPRIPTLPEGYVFQGVEWWPPQPRLRGFAADDSKPFCASAHVPGECQFTSASGTTAEAAVDRLEEALR